MLKNAKIATPKTGLTDKRKKTFASGMLARAKLQPGIQKRTIISPAAMLDYLPVKYRVPSR